MGLGLKEDPESTWGLAPLSRRHVHAHTRQQSSNWFLEGARPLRRGRKRETEGEREHHATNVLCCHLKDTVIVLPSKCQPQQSTFPLSEEKEKKKQMLLEGPNPTFCQPAPPSST